MFSSGAIMCGLPVGGECTNHTPVLVLQPHPLTLGAAAGKPCPCGCGCWPLVAAPSSCCAPRHDATCDKLRPCVAVYPVQSIRTFKDVEGCDEAKEELREVGGAGTARICVCLSS